MKKITLTESDLLKIVNKVLNEQKKRQFNEDEINFLYWVFERELKPPFTKGNKDVLGRDQYYNRNNEIIGCFIPPDIFIINDHPFWQNIKHKICSAFGFSTHSDIWWFTINPLLKSWLEDQLNIKLKSISL